MGRVEYGTDGYPYKLSMSTGIENTEQYPTVKAISKADYENRLKAEKVAMLIELKAEIEELRAKKHFQYKHGQEHGLNDALELIQEKINSLKENKNEIYSNS